MNIENLKEKVFYRTSFLFLLLIIGVFSLFFISLAYGSLQAISYNGVKFIYTKVWDPVHHIYGALPFIYGTLITSIIALILAIPISLGIAISSSELISKKIVKFIDPLIETMAAIPSIVYGMWALFVLGPFLRKWIEPLLNRYLGFLPFFQGKMSGYGFINASIILFIMILPIISSLSREAIKAVPRDFEELIFSVGGTKWEAIITKIEIARNGIIGSIVLGLSRAIGETMAVLLVIGNVPIVSPSLFSSGSTIASVLANEYPEAISNPLYFSTLNELALSLLIISVVLDIIFLKFIKGTVGVIR